MLPYATIAADNVTSPKHRFRSGQILYSKIRPYLCKAVVVDFAGLCSADMYPISAKIDARYLHRWMISSTFTEWASGSQGRTVLPKINQDALSRIEIPVPPLAEQRRIVAKIEALTARSRAARAALADVPALLEQFRQSVLASAFRGDLTADWRAKHPDAEPASALLGRIRGERRRQWEAKYPKKPYVEPDPVDDADLPELPDGWCWTNFGELVHSIRSGNSATATQNDTGFPVLRSSAVRHGSIDFEDFSFLDPSASDNPDNFLSPGDLLITRLSGSVDYVGNCATVPSRAGIKMQYPDQLFRARLAAGVLHSFIEFCFQHTGLRRGLEAAAKSSAGHQRISISDLVVYPIPLPPTAEQYELVRRTTHALATAHAESQRVGAMLAELSALDQSILAKAFRGELVPQDPTDEPASVLLERIRTAQADETANGTPRRRVWK